MLELSNVKILVRIVVAYVTCPLQMFDQGARVASLSSRYQIRVFLEHPDAMVEVQTLSFIFTWNKLEELLPEQEYCVLDLGCCLCTF